MAKVFEKAESIRKAVEAYKKDFILSMRDAGTLYGYLY